MPFMWSILRKLSAHTEHCVNLAIRDRAEFLQSISGFSAWRARSQAADEVYAEVKELFQEGGVEAVQQRFRCVPRQE